MPYNLTTARNKELKYFSKDFNRHPTKLKAYKEIIRISAKIPQEMHTVGNYVEHKGKLARIVKVQKEGVYLQYITNKDEGIFGENPHPFFIPEHRYEKEAFPYYVVQ
jgi:hypothetical protein